MERARETVDVASMWNRYSLRCREHEPVLAACEEAGIAFLPWWPVAAAASEASSEITAAAAELDAPRAGLAHTAPSHSEDVAR